MHVGPEDFACGPRRPEEVVEGGLRRGRHLRTGLGTEVLDDHLLHVAVALVQDADRLERLESLVPGLADPDQDPRGERDRKLAGEADRLQPSLGKLVRRAVVRHALLRKPGGSGLQHDPLRSRHRPQQGELVPCHHAGVHVREEARLGEYELAHAREIFDRRLAAELGELLARGAVAALRLVPEGEERLVAAGLRPRARHLEHLVRPHVRALSAARGLREGAVVADVAAELRQRDEDLWGVGDQRHASIAS